MRKLIDLEHPFFKPVWVRIAVVAVCVLWGLFELSQGNGLWAVVFIGMGAICGYRFSVIDYANMADHVEAPQDHE